MILAFLEFLCGFLFALRRLFGATINILTQIVVYMTVEIVISFAAMLLSVRAMSVEISSIFWFVDIVAEIIRIVGFFRARVEIFHMSGHEGILLGWKHTAADTRGASATGYRDR
ncbi:MAG: hypothetical protein C0507_00860 [Cyanobacteria bacterium PR.3.49]|nr:hypothetical protein [Cyanobacteria bacterium PR.3.49]